MKMLKTNLKQWNKDVFGFLNINKLQIIYNIDEIDDKDHGSNLCKDMRLNYYSFLVNLNCCAIRNIQF